MESTYRTALSDQAQSGAQGASDLVRDEVMSRNGYSSESKTSGRQALESARAYAKEAVFAAGDKVGGLKAKAGELKDQGSHYVAEQPVRSVLMAAVGGAALAALLVAAIRRSH